MGEARPGRAMVRFGEAELLPDLDHPGGWLLTVDGVPQSYVDEYDPFRLEFDYVRRLGDLVDLAAPPSTPLATVHIGGGACTLARYLAATRPGSAQRVVDADGELVAFLTAHLGMDIPGVRVTVGDGRAYVATLSDRVADLVVLDAFERASVPGGLATVEFAREAARVLAPDGMFLLNVSDGPGLLFGRRVAATLLATFAHVLLLAEPGVLRGRRYGNLVLAASASPLPVSGVAARAAAAPFPSRCLAGAHIPEFTADARPLTDHDTMPSPTPPWGLLGRA
ncbi:spermidine synthase [Actinokineospora guangxiensis]|uniref:Spermidine synthase n=1 Tax=Actinokineospora guangxiensis TaxID=1490288 RepID=A0ABW0ELN8_9PSEU